MAINKINRTKYNPNKPPMLQLIEFLRANDAIKLYRTEILNKRLPTGAIVLTLEDHCSLALQTVPIKDWFTGATSPRLKSLAYWFTVKLNDAVISHGYTQDYFKLSFSELKTEDYYYGFKV